MFRHILPRRCAAEGEIRCGCSAEFGLHLVKIYWGSIFKRLCFQGDEGENEAYPLISLFFRYPVR
jgi:hypothetical protein